MAVGQSPREVSDRVARTVFLLATSAALAFVSWVVVFVIGGAR